MSIWRDVCDPVSPCVCFLRVGRIRSWLFPEPGLTRTLPFLEYFVDDRVLAELSSTDNSFLTVRLTVFSVHHT